MPCSESQLLVITDSFTQKIRDPEGTAVMLPGEDATTSRQKLLTLGGVLSYCVLSLAGPPLVFGTQALYTGMSDRHFVLHYDGRKVRLDCQWKA